MKKLLTLLSGLALAGSAQASHVSGAEIRYAAEGSKYRVYLTVYSECSVTVGASASVDFTGCGATFTRSLPLAKTDTLIDGFCASAGAGCGSGSFNYPVVLLYSDTVSLPACASWKMSYTVGARNATINNLSNPAGTNLYVEAMLNNSSAPNTMAKPGSYAPAYSFAGTANYYPLHTTDPDGDSTVYELIQPRGTSGAGLTYASTAFSPTQPLGGTNTAVLAAQKLLRLQGASQGRFVVVLRTSDYRNGVLVGYSVRDWTITNIAGTNPKVPVPSLTNNFVYNACPGAAASLALSFVDSTATDSVVMSVEPSIPLAVSLTGGAGVGSATGTLSWATPSTLNPATTPYFYLRVKVRDNACPFRGVATYDVLVNVTACAPDSVWPGDADANKVVNLYDPLAVAVAAGKTGPARPGATTAWTAQPCPNWSTAFSNNINHKHADCDGNGTVNLADLGAIATNYSLTHPKPSDDGPAAKVTGNPDLRVNSTGVALKRGATVAVPIKLGDANSVQYNLYGVAARVRIINLTPTTQPDVDFSTTWIGVPASMVRFTKPLSNTSVEWACGRTDGININGQGTLGTLQVAVPATAVLGSKVIFRIEAAKLIDKNGTELTAFNVVDDTATIVATSAGVPEIAGVTDAAVVPNPSSGVAVVQAALAQPGAVTLHLVNAVGQAVWTSREAGVAGPNRWSLPAATLPAGWYFLSLRTDAGTEPVTLRWLVQH